MDIEYYMKLQNAYGTKNKREKNLAKINKHANRHFEDTFDTQDVLVNNEPMQLMIIKDTDNNTYKKKIKSRHNDIIRLGDYVKWNNQIYIITLLDTDDKVWNRGYMYLCQLMIRWQNVDGKIVERWGYSEDYTKYSMGEKGNSTITLGDYQYGLTIPVDEETKQLNRTNRFVIDYEGVYPPDTYRMTGKKGFLSDVRYIDKGGVMTVTLSYERFNEVTDKLIKLDNGIEAWICDYKSPTTPTLPPSESDNPIISATITGNTNLKIGISRTYTVSFMNGNSKIEGSSIDFKWYIKSKFPIEQKVSGEYNENITLKVSDEDYIDDIFELQIIVNESILSKKEITIVDVI